MSRTKTDLTTPAASSAESSIPYTVLRSRWLLVIALTALVAFGAQTRPTAAQYSLLVAMILSNLVLGYLRNRDIRLTQALEVLTVVDVLVVTLVVGWVDPAPETYLAVFAALVLASALGRVGVIMPLMLLVCAVYAGYLYTEIGPDFWRDVTLIVRVPFLFAVGLHFASIASYLKNEKAQREDLLVKAKKHAERAEHLSKEQDRLRALSHIGRLGLTSAEAPPTRVLLEMAQRAQRALNAARCSLVVLRQDEQGTKWNGHSKDRSIEVTTLPAEIGPEALLGLLLNGKLTELHPGESKELMAKVKVFFPDSNPFGSLLISPIEKGEQIAGAMFLIDSDHSRKFTEGERDFFWTVSLMAGAFIDARERLEKEIRLRTLITNAPVIMFALGTDGTIELFEGRGSEALGGRPADRIGRSIFDVAGDPDETRRAFDIALGGRLVSGTLSLDGTVFETQYSPLRSFDGSISGVMGVTTAILDTPETVAPPAPAFYEPADSLSSPMAPQISFPAADAPNPPRAELLNPTPGASARPNPTPGTSALPSPPPGASAPRRQPESPAPARPAFPTARPDLKPQIPLKDEDPDDG